MIISAAVLSYVCIITMYVTEIWVEKCVEMIIVSSIVSLALFEEQCDGLIHLIKSSIKITYLNWGLKSKLWHSFYAYLQFRQWKHSE